MMDLLQKELQRKKDALLRAKDVAAFTVGDDDDDRDGRDEASSGDGAGGGLSGPKRKGNDHSTRKRKYLRMADLRRIEEEEKEKEEVEKLIRRQQHRHREKAGTPLVPSSSKKNRAAHGDIAKSRKTSNNDTGIVDNDENEISTSDRGRSDANDDPSGVTRQLRVLGLEVRFFGENHKQRQTRLKEALEEQSNRLRGLSEMEEFRLGKGHGIRNPFLERDGDQHKQRLQSTSAAAMSVMASGSAKPSRKEGGNIPQSGEGLPDKEEDVEKKENKDEDDQTDPPKIIYKYLKGLLREWEQDLADRPEAVARTVAGRNESKTLKQCKDYIRPLFKLLKSRKLEDGLLFHLLKIVNFAKEGEFVKAHDTYMDVAIGRAAWPIGVTMVGIHARSGRAKIESAKVAHVMNSELQRKYLTSVKRLLTFAQKKRPDVDPSKKVT
jgi:pre-mRNA-splicing factor 18